MSDYHILELHKMSWLYNLLNVLKTTKLCILKGWVLWYITYISVFKNTIVKNQAIQIENDKRHEKNFNIDNI